MRTTNGTADSNAVYETISTILVDSLGVDEEAIQPEVRLVEDLGAESIDFLDIAFRVEEELGVRMPMKEWAKASETEYTLTPERLVQRLWRVFRIDVSEQEAARLLHEGLDPLVPVLEERCGYTLTTHELGRFRAAIDHALPVKEFAARQIELFTVQSLVNFVNAARCSAERVAAECTG
jgi:acyl carrier protein